MRLFVAVDIADEVRTRLANLLQELRASNPDLKWVRPESLHVTLKFLGEQKDDQARYITELLSDIKAPAPFDMTLRGLGCFPNERRPRVFWVGVDAPGQLAELAELVDGALEQLGIPREKRAFSPHLTLARAREEGPVPAPGPVWQKHLDDDFGVTRVNEFILYQSKLHPSGAQYTRLRVFPL